MAGIWPAIIKRLDALDGKANGAHNEHSLRPLKACEFEEDFSPLGVNPNLTTPRMRTSYGDVVEIDCASMAERLSVLIGAAEKMPFFPFIALAATDGVSIPKGQRKNMQIRENLLGYQYINHMISALLMGDFSPELSLGEIFETIDFKSYSDSIRGIAADYPEVRSETPAGRLDVYDAQTGYKILKHLGRKFGFNPKPFMPPKPQPPSKTPAPRERYPFATATV